MFDSDRAALVSTQRGMDDCPRVLNASMDDRQVLFRNRTDLPNLSHFQSSGGMFCNEHQSGGFAIQAVDQVGPDRATQIKAHASDEACESVSFGGMTNQVRRFVEDQQIVILVNNVQQR